MAAVFYAQYIFPVVYLVMWKVKLDDGLWLAEGSVTMNEEEAWLLPDMPSVQAQLKKVRRFTPYPNAIVISVGNQAQTD